MLESNPNVSGRNVNNSNNVQVDIKEEKVQGTKKSFFKINTKPSKILIFTVFILLISFVVIYALTLGKSTNSSVEQISDEPTENEPQEEIIISEIYPEDGSVFNEELIVISGKTNPNSLVTVYTLNDVNSVESDNEGKFEADLNLIPGINTISLTSYGLSSEKNIEFDIIYDDSVMGVKSQNNSSGKQEKSQLSVKTESNTKALIGQIDNIDSSSITIENTNNKKETITINKNTKIIGENNKQVSASYINTQQIVAVVKTENSQKTASGSADQQASKIYIKETTGVKKRNSIQGIVLSINENTLTLIHQVQTNRQYQIVLNENTIYKIKNVENPTVIDLKTGYRIVVIGDNNDDSSITAKRIHVIPAQADGIFLKHSSELPISPIESSDSATLTPMPTTSTSSAY